MTTTRRSRTIQLAGAAVVAAVAFALVACAGGDDDSSAELTAPADLQRSESYSAAGSDTADADASTGDLASRQPASEGEADAFALPAGIAGLGRSIVVTGSAGIEVPDVPAAVDQISAIVTARGGAVFDVDLQMGDPEHARAMLVVRLPPEELEATIADLGGVGTLLSRTQESIDVTEQLVDLDSRIATARASVERVRALLAEAVDIEDVVRVEGELTRREADLESLLGSQRVLDDQVAMSTLTIELSTSAEGIAALSTTFEDPRPTVVEALADGWSAFAGMFATAAVALALAGPFLVTGLLVAAVVWFARRNRRPVRQATSAAGPGAG